MGGRKLFSVELTLNCETRTYGVCMGKTLGIIIRHVYIGLSLSVCDSYLLFLLGVEGNKEKV